MSFFPSRQGSVRRSGLQRTRSPFASNNLDEKVEGKVRCASISASPSATGTPSRHGRTTPFGPGLRAPALGRTAPILRSTWPQTRSDVAFEFHGVSSASVLLAFTIRDGRRKARASPDQQEPDAVVRKLRQKQKDRSNCFGARRNLFSNARFSTAAIHQPERRRFAYSAAQVKKAWNDKELGRRRITSSWARPQGYVTHLEHGPERELDHLASPAHGRPITEEDRLYRHAS